MRIGHLAYRRRKRATLYEAATCSPPNAGTRKADRGAPQERRRANQTRQAGPSRPFSSPKRSGVTDT
ncbi:hypothetical protein GCM10022287_15550 [Gryllotalpicola koreensis]|uniref:Uncharacterized protein n=1 Tax=Gryllotalpicola koreensis TaxID=993086 RepID=A0ABP7ZY68_9MICO